MQCTTKTKILVKDDADDEPMKVEPVLKPIEESAQSANDDSILADFK